MAITGLPFSITMTGAIVLPGRFPGLGRVHIFLRPKPKIREAVIEENACPGGNDGGSPMKAEGLGGADNVARLVHYDEVGRIGVFCGLIRSC